MRIKIYSYTKYDAGRGLTAKGAKKSVMKKIIIHKNYRKVLLNSQQRQYNMMAIRCTNHQSHSYNINNVQWRS